MCTAFEFIPFPSLTTRVFTFGTPWRASPSILIPGGTCKDTDNPFFRYTTAEWPISRLVDLTTDARLVEKLPHAVLYEEGETAARIIGKDPLGAALVSNTPNNGVGGKRRTWATFHQGQGKTGACGGVQAKAGSRGRIGLGNRLGRRLDREGTGGEAEEPWAAGAYVIMRGSVCLHVLER